METQVGHPESIGANHNVVKRIFGRTGYTIHNKSANPRISFHEIGEILKNILQFIKFALVGVSNTGISLGIYYMVLFINEDFYLMGHVLGFLISVVNSCYWNNRFVFQNKETPFWKLLLKSYLAYGFSFLFSTISLVVMIQLLHISQIIAPIVNIIVTTPLNFMISKLWTFRT